MKKTALKQLSALLSAVLLAGAVAGCGSGTGETGSTGGTQNTDAGQSDKSGKKVVRVGYQGIFDKDTIDPISGITKLSKKSLEELLEKKLPDIDVEITTVPSNNWIQTTETLITSGELDVAWYTNQVLAADWFADHTEFMKDDPDVNLENLEDVFIAPAVSYIKYSSFEKPNATGKIFGFPMDMSNYFMVYDTQLLEEWGVEALPQNATYEQMLDAAQRCTGTNPVTGKPNFGAYLRSFWLEWHSIGFDATKSISLDDMSLANLDIANDIDYARDSENVLNYFQYILDAMKCAPPGITTDTGSEKFFTPDNDIAVNMDVSCSGTYLSYLYAGKTDVTDRYKPIFMPTSQDGKQGFPEFHKIAVTNNAKDPQAAWEVVKALTTDKEIVNFIITNYTTSGLPCLKDATDMKVLEYDLNQQRYDFHSQSIFVTSDYWYWRQPLQTVLTKVIGGEMDAPTAREAFVTEMHTWVENRKAQLG